MRSAGTRGIATQVFAMFVAAYCALASGRALVPGLCARLADLKADTAVSCHTPQPACCRAGETDAPAAITHAMHDCAFCALVHRGVPLEAAPAIHTIAFNAPLQLAAYDNYVPDPAGFGACTRRGPPLSRLIVRSVSKGTEGARRLPQMGISPERSHEEAWIYLD